MFLFLTGRLKTLWMPNLLYRLGQALAISARPIGMSANIEIECQCLDYTTHEKPIGSRRQDQRIRFNANLFIYL
jgi:hypothetical protein